MVSTGAQLRELGDWLSRALAALLGTGPAPGPSGPLLSDGMADVGASPLNSNMAPAGLQGILHNG